MTNLLGRIAIGSIYVKGSESHCKGEIVAFWSSGGDAWLGILQDGRIYRCDIGHCEILPEHDT